jgi:hypothetical protein
MTLILQAPTFATGIKKRRLPGSAFINPLFFFLSFHHIPQCFQFRLAE